MATNSKHVSDSVLARVLEYFRSWRWTTSAVLTRLRLPQIAGLLPILGYAILFGDQIGRLLHYPDLGTSLFFSPLQRLYLLYWGGIFLLAGYLVFRLFCPHALRTYAFGSEYIQSVLQAADLREYERALTAVSPLYDQLGAGDSLHGLSKEEISLGINTGKLDSIIANPEWHYRAAVVLRVYYDELNLGPPSHHCCA